MDGEQILPFFLIDFGAQQAQKEIGAGAICPQR
jgi:hypothetical protein